MTHNAIETEAQQADKEGKKELGGVFILLPIGWLVSKIPSVLVTERS